MAITHRPRLAALFAAAITTVASAMPAWAHFTFIVPEEGAATAKLVMSETLEPDDEVSAEMLGHVNVLVRDIATGKDQPATATMNKQYIGLTLPGSGATRLAHAKVDLGVHQRGTSPANLLVYYTKTIIGDAFDAKTRLGSEVPVELVPVKDATAGVRFLALADGKPMSNIEFTVIRPDGVQDKYKTNDEGLSPAFEDAGRYGAWARNWLETPGERDGKPYQQVRNYALLVFDYLPNGATPVVAKPATQPTAAAEFPAATEFGKLPEPSASFGAVAADGWMYVYGGHITDRHEYSTSSVSGKFHRMNLADPSKWETLPGGVHVQGLNLATHGGKIYRVGGMQPHNEEGQPVDNWSNDQAQVYDPATGKWSDLPKVPTPRSSHDVAVIDDKLYVLGGWQMRGKLQDNLWVETIDVLDLSASEPKWSTIPQPFSRRAMIVAVAGTKLYAIGGFDNEDTAHLTVNVYDAATDSWSTGPNIPGSPRNGFSPAACTIDGRVILSVGSGELYRLSADGSAWEQIGKATPRIVHRLIPHGDSVLIVGGARGPKMTDLIEQIRIPAITANAQQ